MNKQRLLLFIPLIIFLILVVFFFRGLSLDPHEMPSALIGKPVPEFELPILAAAENPTDITVADSSIFKGQVSLLNVWATWCITCRQEHEFLLQLKEQGVVIYGINYKDDEQKAQQWLARLHNPYVFSVSDQDGILGLNLGVFGAPETYLIDPKGVIRYKHVGDVNPMNWEAELKPELERVKKEFGL